MSVFTTTAEKFNEDVLNAGQPVLVDFWATWCGPCRMLSPVVEELSNEREDLKFCKVNVDEEPDLASKYKIMSIPALLLFQNGELTATSVGLLSKEELRQWIDSNISGEL